MDCESTILSLGLQFLSDGLNNTETRTQLSECVSTTVCDQIYGPSNFDLGGTGVYWGRLIHIALFFLFGPVLAFISRCISPHSSRRTRLTVARLQAAMDTIFSTSCMVSIAYIITGYIRISQGVTFGLERHMLNYLIEGAAMLHNLIILAYIIERKPAGIQISRRWNGWSVLAMSQIIGFPADKVKRRIEGMYSADRAPTLTITQNLCHKLLPELYPALTPGRTLGSDGKGTVTNPYIIGFILGILLNVSIALGVFLFPKNIKTWIVAFITSRIVGALVAVLYLLACLFSITYGTFELFWTRGSFEDSPPWDLAQIGALLVWCRAGWHVLLSLLVSIEPAEDNREDAIWKRPQTILSTFFETMCKCCKKSRGASSQC